MLQLEETTSHLIYTYELDGASSYAIDVYPGTYDVSFRILYDGVIDGASLDLTLLDSDVAVTRATTYNVAPAVVPLSGSVTFNGGAIPDTYGADFDEWVLQLVETTSGLVYTYDLDGASSYSIDVYPGTYDVYFRMLYDSVIDGAPTDFTLLDSDVRVSAATTYDVTPATAELSGLVTYDGAVIPDTYGSGYDEYELVLTEIESGLTYTYGLDGGSGGAYAVSVYPGIYDVQFRILYDGVIAGASLDFTVVGECLEITG